jgi:Protein of unknown function (DUF4242)
MPMYLVERILPEVTLDSVEAIRSSAEAACREPATQGNSVRYVRSIFTPGESRCRCLFEARNADLIRELNDAAQLPYNRILIALELPGSPELTPEHHNQSDMEPV